MSKYKGAIIADIHAGAFNGAILYKELKEGFISHLKEMNKLDFIIIAGDLFDTKISLNSDNTKFIFEFLKDIMKIAIKHNASIRIIKGTESHDNQQLDTLLPLLNPSCNIKIINTVTDEYLFDDFHVLYIPEEYMKDKDDFYKDYFNQRYDMIFGHGMVNEVAFASKSQMSEVTMSKAPIFKTQNLIDICYGPIFFGHIHKHQRIKEHMYYVGSYSRWCFGEDEDKGFMTVSYDTETYDYKTKFIVNELARTFDTIVIDYNSSFYKSVMNNNPTDEIQRIIDVANAQKADKLRIIFNIPEDYEQPGLLISLINDVFSKHNNVKVVINNNAKNIRTKKETEERTQMLLSTYDFLFDKSIPTDEKLVRYIKIKYNKDIDIDRMRDILYQKLTVNSQ